LCRLQCQLDDVLANLARAHHHPGVSASVGTSVAQPRTADANVGANGDTRSSLQQFTFAQLSQATGDFDDARIIGSGGYGSVYKGELHGTSVAVKVLSEETREQGVEQFEREVHVLSSIHHPHIVGLIGYCTERYCLVYELMEGGSLEDLLNSR
jgi:hypothetical protein